MFHNLTIGAIFVVSSLQMAFAHDFYVQPGNPQIPVYAERSAHNFCPAGLQPVSVGGAVSCGVPTHTHGRVIVLTPTPPQAIPHLHAPVRTYSNGYAPVAVQPSKRYGRGQSVYTNRYSR